MRRSTPIIKLSLNKHQFLLPSSQFNSRLNLIHRNFHVSKPLLENHNLRRRRSNGIGLVCLEDNNNHKDHQTKNNDEYASDVEKSYRILRKFHSRVPKLELALNESGIELRPGLIERVLNRCGDAGNLGYRFFLWAAKQQPGYRHNHEVYKSMTKILTKMRQFGSVWVLIEEMRKENPQLIEPELFVVLVNRFPSLEIVKKAVQVLDEMPKPDEYIFSCLLDALCNHSNVKDAAKLFEEMRFRFPTNLRYFSSLLCGWCREGKMIEAKHVLFQMKEAGFEPDIVVYTDLLNGYVNSGKIADGYELLNDMRRKGIEPNANCYTVLIQGLCKVDRMEEAMRVFAECEGDHETYTALINGFCKSGKKIDKCYSLLNDMIKKGFVPSQVTYMNLLLVHEKREEFEECLKLMKELRYVLDLDLSVYNVVLRLAFKLGEVKHAIRLWNEMEMSLVVVVDTFVIMIDGLISNGCLLEACGYFKDMVTRGLFTVSQHRTLKSLLNSVLRDEKKLEMAKDVWNCVASVASNKDVLVWTIWIDALFSRGYAKEACCYCVEMMEMGLMMKPETFGKFMKGLKKFYGREFAVEITEKMKRMAVEREVSFKMYKRRGVQDLSEKGQVKKDREMKKKKAQ